MPVPLSNLQRVLTQSSSRSNASMNMSVAMLSMFPRKVDDMLRNGHDWANDHIATSKDDVEEVFNWLTAEMR